MFHHFLFWVKFYLPACWIQYGCDAGIFRRYFGNFLIICSFVWLLTYYIHVHICKHICINICLYTQNDYINVNLFMPPVGFLLGDRHLVPYITQLSFPTNRYLLSTLSWFFSFLRKWIRTNLLASNVSWKNHCCSSEPTLFVKNSLFISLY